MLFTINNFYDGNTVVTVDLYILFNEFSYAILLIIGMRLLEL